MIGTFGKRCTLSMLSRISNLWQRGCLGEMKSDIHLSYQVYPLIFEEKSFKQYLEKIDQLGKKLNNFIKTTNKPY